LNVEVVLVDLRIEFKKSSWSNQRWWKQNV